MQKPLTWMSILIVLAGQSLLQLLTSESDCAIFLDTSCCRALSVTWWLCDMTKSSHFICTPQIHATTGNKKVWKVPILSSQTDNAYLPAWEFFFFKFHLVQPIFLTWVIFEVRFFWFVIRIFVSLCDSFSCWPVACWYHCTSDVSVVLLSLSMMILTRSNLW